MAYSKDCSSGTGVCWPNTINCINGGNCNWGAASFVLNNGFMIRFDVGYPANLCNSSWNGHFNSYNVCYAVALDVNGANSLNSTQVFGQGIFKFWVLGNGTVVPNGTQDVYPASTDCTSTGNGYGSLYLGM